MPIDTTQHVRCPHCQTAFRALPEHAGRRAKCSHCGGTIVVPGEPVPPPTPPPPAADQPQYVGVNCSLCDTRMYGTLADVGKQLKCPDCGRLTKLPPPEVKRHRVPAAMEGEQYEVWEGDDQPWGITLSSSGPKYIAVECRLCQTHLQAAIDRVGKKIRCHDCGAETVVRLPASGAKAKAPPTPPPDEYEVDDPVVTTSAAAFYMPDVIEGETVKIVRKGKRPDGPPRQPPLDGDFMPRPKLPRWPLLTGTLSFLRTPGIPARILVMSGSILILPGALLAIIISVGSDILAVILLPPLVIISLIWIAAMAAASMAIVTESSEGNEQVYAWPSSAFMDWLPELGTMLIALMCSAFPGWLIARFVPDLSQVGLLPMAVSVLLLLPVTLLSQLAESSVWAVVSPNIVLSWFRCPLSWLGFYLQSIAILAVVGTVSYATLALSGWISLLLVPLVVTGAFYYFRIIGRLGWVIVETAPVEVDEQESE